MPPSRFPMSSVYASLQEMSLRILHINKRYPPHVGGVERHVQELALAQSARADVQVEVLCVAEEGEGRGRAHGREGAGGCGRWERDGRVAVHRVPEWALVASNPVSPWIGRELERSRQSRLHEVWHFHYPFPTGEAACLRQAARRAAAGPPAAAPRPAVICTYHSDFVGDGGLKRALGPAYGRLTRAFLSAVDRIVVASPQLASYSRFLPDYASKVRVVPFGIDLSRFQPAPRHERMAAALRERYGAPLILFVGRFVPYKGVDVLLEAMALLGPGAGRAAAIGGAQAEGYASSQGARAAAETPVARLVLVGDGPLRHGLEERATGWGLGGRVHFVGTVSDDELVAWYHAADVFVLPSVTPNEAFGLVQLEAHACGLPVVSTNLPSGVPFANADGVSGLVVEPGDAKGLAAALRRLLTDPELRARLGRQARERVYAEFLLEIMTRRILDVYAELL